MKLMKMEDLFKTAGLCYQSMEKNVFYDVSDKNISIKSFNHKTGKNEMKKILSFVRKDDAIVYHLVTKEGNILLKCSGAHRIWDERTNSYQQVENIESGYVLTTSGKKIEFFSKKTEGTSPIVDLEVEGNENYFTNGILSHNTTSGGNALKFYASIRLKVSKIGTIESGSGDDKEKTSIRTRVEAVKNKTAPPFQRGEFIVTFGKGIDNEAAYFDAIIEKGLVQTKGAGWYAIDGKNVAQGTTKLKAYFEQNPDVYAKLKQQLVNSTSAEKETAHKADSTPDASNMTDEQIADKVTEEMGEITSNEN